MKQKWLAHCLSQASTIVTTIQIEKASAPESLLCYLPNINHFLLSAIQSYHHPDSHDINFPAFLYSLTS